MAKELNPALFEDSLSPGYNSFSEAVQNAVIAAMQKRREQGLVHTEPPQTDTGEKETVEDAAEAARTDASADAGESSEAPEEGQEPLDFPGNASDSQETPDSNKIKDFGEKLGGARKDLYQRYREMIMQVNDDEISKYPMSKLWPKPDYTKLLEEGLEPWKVVMLRILREDLGKRPPATSFKAREWNRNFLYNRNLAETILDPNNASDFASYMFFGGYFPRKTVSKAHMYLHFGPDIEVSDFPYYADYIPEDSSITSHGETYTDCYVMRKKGIWWDSVEKGFSDQASAMDAVFEANRPTVEAEKAFQEAKKKQAEEEKGEASEKPRKYDDFRILSWRGSKGYSFIGKKVNGEWVEVKKPFQSPEEARAYLSNHLDEVQDLFDAYKDVPNLRKLIRRTENLPRTESGNPERAADITPEDFANAFGFRGVEFGNWVEDKKRQKDLNEAYDGLMDLAHILNVPPKALSLCGELGLRFGSNGRGGANAAKAHYEPDFKAINLTKKKGAGSLAHEWFHAMDHYFNYHAAEKKDSFTLLTESEDISNLSTYLHIAGTGYAEKGRKNIYENNKIRQEVLDKFAGLKLSFEEEIPEVKHTYPARCKKLDKTRGGKPYWGTAVEMAARAFEAYVYDKLAERGIRNDFLVNYLTPQEYDSVAQKNPARLSDTYPYPLPEEMAVIGKAFDDLFEAIDSRDVKDGKVEMYSSSDYRQARLDQCETVFDEELSGVQMELKRFSGAVLGLDVEFYDGPETFHGSYDPLEDKVLLNINSEKPVDWVLWHEAFHAFKNLEPETFSDLMDYMDKFSPITPEQIAAYRESTKGYDLPEAIVKEELLADAFADLKKRQAIAEQMKEKDPGLLGRVSGYFSRVKDMARKFFFRKDDVKLTEEQFSHFEYAVSQIEISRLGSEQKLFDELHPDGYTEKEYLGFPRVLEEFGMTPRSRRILETDASSLEAVMRAADGMESRRREDIGKEYRNETEHARKRMSVIDFTPLQQKDFDVRFAKAAIADGARPKDVEYVLGKASPLGTSRKTVKEIMQEAKTARTSKKLAVR